MASFLFFLFKRSPLDIWNYLSTKKQLIKINKKMKIKEYQTLKNITESGLHFLKSTQKLDPNVISLFLKLCIKQCLFMLFSHSYASDLLAYAEFLNYLV